MKESTIQKPDPFASEVATLLREKRLIGTLFPGGGIQISGWSAPFPEGERYWKRGKIGDASPRSLRRCSFNLQNCSVKWEVMITLTFRQAPDDPVKRFRHWQATMPWAGRQDLPWGWFREYQSRGVLHWHVCLGEGVLASLFGEDGLILETVGRGKKKRTVCRGRPEYWIVSRWIEAVGDLSAQFQDFQWGGIVEIMRDCDSPARYLGAYASKASQKKLPDGETFTGRWWYLSAACKLVPRGTFELWSWPLDYPSSVIWDYKQLDPSIA